MMKTMANMMAALLDVEAEKKIAKRVMNTFQSQKRKCTVPVADSNHDQATLQLKIKC